MFETPPRAPHAVGPATARGRAHAEPEATTRTPWQRDRDRIIHSSAFRKLQYKTQVFVNHEGDFFRTRLTHSIEVAQIARSVARALGLEEDLAEALALAHDLGHTPFGHAGEEALDACMKPFGGYDHNAQALRIVTRLESRYAAFDGLNLTWETLEGLAKHNGPLRHPPPFIAEFDAQYPLQLETHASAEAQVAALCDDIAYHGHDLDDGIRAGLFAPDDLAHLPLVGDLLAESTRRIAALAPAGPDAVRGAGHPVIGFSREVAAGNGAIRQFLFARMYRHWRVNRMTSKARRVTTELFRILHENTALLPDDWRPMAGPAGTERAAHTVADYIAGMTDRFAIEEHRRLTDLAVPG